MFTMELGTDVEEMLSINPSSENVTLILQTKSSAFDIIKMNFKSSNRDKEFVGFIKYIRLNSVNFVETSGIRIC